MACRSLCVAFVFLFSSCVQEGESACLPGAVPPEDRVNISLAGRVMPIGLTALNWDSSLLYREIYALLLQEVLGYNVVLKAASGSTMASAKEVAGCTEGGTKCDRTWSEIHATNEVWAYYETDINGFFNQPGYTDKAPLLANYMGYRGSEGMFVFGKSAEPALAETGKSLDYYQDLNASFISASKYFSKINEFDIFNSPITDKFWPGGETDFKRCSDWGFWVMPEPQEEVLRIFNDTESFYYQDGVRKWKCVNDTWWAAPSCRQDPLQCIPTLSSGYGWFILKFIQKAIAFDIQLGVAIVGWYAYLELPVSHKVFTYWWTPDASFTFYNPINVIFPPHNVLEFRQGIQTSAVKSVKTGVWVNKHFPAAAPKALILSQLMTVYQSDVDDLLMTKVVNAKLESEGKLPAGSSSLNTLACQWLNGNEDRWRRWIPKSTNCDNANGYGMATSSGDYTDNRSLASDCKLCSPGKYSSPMKDDEGDTAICVGCPKGTKQEKGAQTSCSPCDPGSFTDEVASFQCKLCPRGTYQNLSSQTGCDECLDPFTTSSVGSTMRTQCICGATSYRPCRDPDNQFALRDGCKCDDDMYVQAGDVRCATCPKGMVCVEGADEVNYPCSSIEQDNLTSILYPVPEPGYMVHLEDPDNVYLCIDSKSCPGKKLGVCGDGLKGVACGACDGGYYKTGGKCERCGEFESNPMFLISPVLIGPLIVYVMYLTAQDPVDKWGVTKQGFGGMFYLTLVFAQTVSAIIGIFPSLPDAIASSLSITQTSAEITSLLRLECAGPQDFQAMFILELGLPTIAGFVFFATWAISQLIPNYAMEKNIVFGSYGGIIKTFFISIATLCFSLLQCYKHPNGEWSMKSEPQIVRSTEEWNSLVVYAAIAIVFNCLGVIVLFTWAMWRAPKQFHNVAFRRRWKFMIMKMRPSVHWWMLTILIKGMWLALTSVIWQTVMTQSIWLMSGLLLYFTGGFILMPWRNIFVATMDTVYHTGLLMLCMCMPFMITFDPEEREQAAYIFCIVAVAACLCVTCALLLTLYEMLPSSRNRREARIRKKAIQAAEIFSAMKEPRLLAEMMTQLPALDIATLKFVALTMHSELFGHRKFPRLQWKPPGEGIRATLKKDELGSNASQLVWA